MTDADLQKIADELGEPIEIVRDLAEAMACCAAEGDDEARVDRFERARDAAFDAPGAAESQVPNIDAAIETATRVRVDDELIEAAREQYEAGYRTIPIEQQRAALTAAFRAAGFEVEQ